MRGSVGLAFGVSSHQLAWRGCMVKALGHHGSAERGTIELVQHCCGTSL